MIPNGILIPGFCLPTKFFIGEGFNKEIVKGTAGYGARR